MAKKKVDPEQVLAGLSHLAPASSNTENQAADVGHSDPIRPTDMVATLDEIDAYDNNLRLSANPEYENIKTTIRINRGLDSSLPITRRPGSSKFMIGAGGNTRLQALRDLYNETGDRAFYQVPCRFRPWTNESTVLLRHLIENDVRGDLTFYELARGIMRLWATLSEESENTISIREFERRLKDLGYSKVSRRTISRYKFVIDILEDSIPKTLLAGLGPSDIDAIERVYRGYSDYWEKNGKHVDQFVLLFQQTLTAHDNDTFRVDSALLNVRSDLDEALSINTGIEIEQVRLATDAIINPGSAVPPRPETPAQQAPETPAQQAPATPAQQTPETPAQQAPATPAQQTPATPAKQKLGQENSTPARQTKPAAAQTIDELRENNYRTAYAIAERFELVSCIEAIATGYGFVVDVPTDPINSQQERQRHWMWWFLTGLSDVLRGSQRLKHIPQDLTLRVMLENDEVFTNITGEPPVVGLVQDLFQRLPPPDLELLLQLIEGCRAVDERSVGTRKPLWA